MAKDALPEDQEGLSEAEQYQIHTQKIRYCEYVLFLERLKWVGIVILLSTVAIFW